MTTVPLNGLSLDLNSPIDPARLDRIVADLARARPRTVLDVGCGWAELLLRVLAAVPGATGVGVDLERLDLDRGRANAEARGLTDRVELRAVDAKTVTGTYDLVLCVGAQHSLNDDPAQALQALRELTADGGRLVFGIDYWLSVPPAERLDVIWGGAAVADSALLPDVVDAAAAAGWRLLDLHEVSQSEWDAYECGLVRNQEEWLLAPSRSPRGRRPAATARRRPPAVVARTPRLPRVRLAHVGRAAGHRWRVSPIPRSAAPSLGLPGTHRRNLRGETWL